MEGARPADGVTYEKAGSERRTRMVVPTEQRT